MEDAALRALIQHPRVEIFVLYVKGEVAGYAECDCRQAPDLELSYFGLLPEFIGQGLGTKFLHWVIATAWSYEPQKFWLHTCTLDHPGALALYQRAGFVIFQQEEKLIDDPRALGLIPHSN